jgi:hypothetical protein
LLEVFNFKSKLVFLNNIDVWHFFFGFFFFLGKKKKIKKIKKILATLCFDFFTFSENITGMSDKERATNIKEKKIKWRCTFSKKWIRDLIFINFIKKNKSQSKIFERKKFYRFSFCDNWFLYGKKSLRWFKFTGRSALFFPGLKFYYVNFRKYFNQYGSFFNMFKKDLISRMDDHHRVHVFTYKQKKYELKVPNFYFKYYKYVTSKFITNMSSYYRRINILKKNTKFFFKISLKKRNIFFKKDIRKLSCFYLPFLQTGNKIGLVLNFWKNKNLLNLKNKLGLFFKFNKFLPKDTLKSYFFSRLYRKLRFRFDAYRRLLLLRKNKKLYSFFCQLKGKGNENKKSMDFLVFSKKFYKIHRKHVNNKKFGTLQINAFWRWIANVWIVLKL